MFTLSAEQTPSKIEISFKEPTFADRRSASKHYPRRAPFSLEELLAANCLEGINGKVPTAIAAEPVGVLKELPNVDEQFYLATFLSMFTLDEDLSERAKSLGEGLRGNPAHSFSVSREDMPRSSVSFSYIVPSAGDRMHVEQRYPGADSNCGYSMEEMLFAFCLNSVNGEVLPDTRDVITRIDDWLHLDAQYALSVFLASITINAEESKSAKALGKKLLSSASPMAQKSSKAKAATTTQASAASQNPD